MTRRTRPQLKLGEILGASAELLKETPGQHLSVTQLRPGSGQPRREFDQQRLEDLATSIREKGILQPLLVRPVDGGYEIVAGERRWRAAQLAELTEVPVVIREFSDTEARQVALIENLQREDLNLLDEVDAKLALVAETLQIPVSETKTRLMQLLRSPAGAEHQALDEAFGLLGESWTSFARGKLRILSWPEIILAAVRQGLAYSIGAVIAGAPAEHQARLVKLAQKGATRAEIQAEVKRLKPAKEAAGHSVRVSRLLGNQQWLAALSDKERQAVESWLAKMPAVMQTALKE